MVSRKLLPGACLLLASILRGAPPAPVTAAIYGGGPLYEGGAAVMNDLRASGFTEVVAWTLHVDESGDLSFNDRKVVAGGRYRGDPGWPARLAGLKRGPVTRLLFSVGSAGCADFHHIQALVQSEGTGPGSRLRASFAALKRAIPAVDGFDLDDEDLMDRATTEAFSAMIGDLGCQVTFCPYEDIPFWVDCLRDLEATRPGLVTAFHLQGYAGGAGNQPADWIAAVGAALGPGFDAAGLVQPGLWCRHGDGCAAGDGPEAMAARFGQWKDQGVRGGFVWLYDDLQHCQAQGAPGATAYARALAGALRSP